MPRSTPALAAAAIALIALTACAATPPPAQTPAPAAESTQAPAPSADPMADRDPTDEFVPLEVVTDEYGTYQRQTLADDAPQLQWDEELVVFDLLEEHGFTPEQAHGAQQIAARYFAEEFLDNERLDNYNAQTTQEWFDELEFPVTPSFRDGSIESDEPFAAGLALGAWLPENTSRDGGPRGTSTFSVIGVEAFVSDAPYNVPQINLGFDFTRQLETTDEAALELWRRLSPDISDAEREARAPELFDGDGRAQIDAIGSLWMGYDPVQRGLASTAGNWVPYLQPSGTSLYPDVDDLK